MAAALAGFAVTLILTALGAAIGLSTGTPADSVRVARDVAAVGSGAAWGLLVSMLAGLGATFLAAGKRREEPATGPV